jgi:integrase/recombinase XerD
VQPRFEQFIRERQYFVNVTESTVEWYRRCLKWLPSEQPTQEELNATLMKMREAGLKVTGVNCVAR